MRHPLDTLAAALLMALAISATAAAQEPPAADDGIELAAGEDTDDMNNMDDTAEDPLYADEAEAQAETDPSEFTTSDSSDEPPPQEEIADHASADAEGGIEAPESRAPEDERLSTQLKRMLIGVLVPAVERRVRKAVGEEPAVEPEPEEDPEF